MNFLTTNLLIRKSLQCIHSTMHRQTIYIAEICWQWPLYNVRIHFKIAFRPSDWLWLARLIANKAATAHARPTEQWHDWHLVALPISTPRHRVANRGVWSIIQTPIRDQQQPDSWWSVETPDEITTSRFKWTRRVSNIITSIVTPATGQEPVKVWNRNPFLFVRRQLIYKA